MPHSNEWFADFRRRAKEPGNCRRCANPNPDALHKTCPRFRKHQAEYQAKRKSLAYERTGKSEAIGKLSKRVKQLDDFVTRTLAVEKLLRDLMKRLNSCEEAIARLQVSVERDHNRTFLKAYRAGTTTERKRQEPVELPTITKQELATMNHAYAGDE